MRFSKQKAATRRIRCLPAAQSMPTPTTQPAAGEQPTRSPMLLIIITDMALYHCRARLATNESRQCTDRSLAHLVVMRGTYGEVDDIGDGRPI